MRIRFILIRCRPGRFLLAAGIDLGARPTSRLGGLSVTLEGGSAQARWPVIRVTSGR